MILERLLLKASLPLASSILHKLCTSDSINADKSPYICALNIFNTFIHYKTFSVCCLCMIAIICWYSPLSGYSSGRCPSMVTSPLMLPFVNASGGSSIIHVPIYVYFISEFTEEVQSLVDLSCDSLAVLCKHMQSHGREDFFLHEHRGLHSFVFTCMNYISSKWCCSEQQSSNCYCWVSYPDWRLHVLKIPNTAQCFTHLHFHSQYKSLILSTLLFHTGTISAQYGSFNLQKTSTYAPSIWLPCS